MKYLKMFLLLVVIVMVARFAMRPPAAPALPPPPAPKIENNSAEDVEKVESSNDDKTTAEWIEKNVYRSDDKFDKSSTFLGPLCNVESKKNCLEVTLAEKQAHRFQSYSIGALYDGERWGYAIVLRMQTSTSDNPKFERALDIDGQSWPVKFKSKIESEGVNLFRESEAFVYVPRTYLEERAHKGIQLKFYGRQDTEINIPSVYLKGVLKGIREK